MRVYRVVRIDGTAETGLDERVIWVEKKGEAIALAKKAVQENDGLIDVDVFEVHVNEQISRRAALVSTLNDTQAWCTGELRIWSHFRLDAGRDVTDGERDQAEQSAEVEG